MVSFDNLRWDLVMRAVRHHTDVPWILLYVERWLRAPVQHEDGRLEERTKGSPQGSVISPLVSNLFMHYAFDEWLRRNYPSIQFARYADDAVVHARSQQEAETLLAALRQRLAECGLELHPEKTKIVYCKDNDRRGTHEHTSFDFSGLYVSSSSSQESERQAVYQLPSRCEQQSGEVHPCDDSVVAVGLDP